MSEYLNNSPDYVERFEEICRKIAETNPAQEASGRRILFTDLQDVMDTFLQYASRIFKMESEKRYVRLCSSTESSNYRISELDSARTSAHNSAMSAGNALNRWCTDILELPKFINLEESSPRREWTAAILEVVRQLIAAGVE